ncbi:MAG: magnesium chelatase subunit D [Deltaproteobacteria bacterium]|jgi:magnesium chelatase subunit D
MTLHAAWAELVRSIALLAMDPRSVGGVLLRGRPGPARDLALAWLRSALPTGTPLVHLPAHVTEDRLLGGLALAESLHAGRPVFESGLLSRADRGIVVCAAAERMAPSVVSALSRALDQGEVLLERDGLSRRVEARVALVVLDEGVDDERAPDALRDRCALAFDLDALPAPEPAALSRLLAGEAAMSTETLGPVVLAAQRRSSDCRLAAADIDALAEAAVALGIDSLRAPMLAAHVARLHAALESRSSVTEEDLALAARLVLGPRARQIPEPGRDPDDAPAPHEDSSAPDSDRETAPEAETASELLVEAAASAVGSGLLDRLRPGPAQRSLGSSGRSGAKRKAASSGRPAGVQSARGEPGQRINVVETLRAAAPWQRLRGRDDARVRVRTSDLRVTRRIERTETTVVFCVDVSGSSAAQRLAEAKGAIERMLRDCYARRDQVALVAFRRAEASLVVPATRSLARARRCLAGLAGGGTTPLATGLEQAHAAVIDARRRGRAALLIVMTDGRANVALDGRSDREAARHDAEQRARVIRSHDVPTLLVDTSPRPRESARALSEALGAMYLALPHPGSGDLPQALDGIRARASAEVRP